MKRGLSPRGRGKPLQKGKAMDGQGSIPAWAGETPTPPSVDGQGVVYPRVGGGNRINP